MFRKFDEKDTRYKCVIRTRTKAETPGLIAMIATIAAETSDHALMIAAAISSGVL